MVAAGIGYSIVGRESGVTAVAAAITSCRNFFFEQEMHPFLGTINVFLMPILLFIGRARVAWANGRGLCLAVSAPGATRLI